MSQDKDLWNEPVELSRMAMSWGRALQSGLIQSSTPAAIFHDISRLRSRLKTLQDVFPTSTNHALAIKANPLVSVLRHAVNAHAGLEAASIEEVWLADAAGCPPERVIFDSPAKSLDEIRQALDMGVWINADNEEELARIQSALGANRSPRGKIGLRVNPLVGEGKIGITSVGGRRSKFGMPVNDFESLNRLYAKYPWLSGIHVHVGSQGTSLEQLVEAVRVAFELRAKLESAIHRPIEFVDIGGGLPARYLLGDLPPTPAAYAQALRSVVPQLFDYRGVLLTEFGRSVQASCGWAISRVEYVKEVGGKPSAILHLGADFLMRPVYRPSEWPHRYYLLDASGNPKTGPERETQLSGPLCFGGDILTQTAMIPPVDVGDLVVIADTGAYTLSLWSRHCNRAIPSVIGLCDDDLDHIEVLKARESRSDIVALWS